MTAIGKQVVDKSILMVKKARKYVVENIYCEGLDTGK